ncbi:MAG: alcohol dehydrogenase catalytic domain-containing protein [Desulfobacteraceae bacterium]|nr:alcohol dehydrogenase catalytic domain-containing protein [Desulfobacteraceae bacterium]
MIMEMSAIRVSRIGAFEWTTVPLRDIGEDEVLIEVEVTGLCRTDLKLIRVGHRDLTLPRIPGEEVVGIVRKTGGSVKGVLEGRRVYVYPGVWCGRCPACRRGAENLCRQMQIMGFHRDGGFAQYVIAPAGSLIPVPEGLDAELAVFAEPLSCCLNALELACVGRGDAVGIWGAGPAGTLLSRAAAAMGAEPLCMEPDDRRRRMAKGVPGPEGRKFDVCIVAVGSNHAYEEALAALNPRGRLVVFAGLSPSDDVLPVSFNQLHYHEQTLVGAYGCSFRHGVRALRFIATGAVTVRDMISHRMALSDLDEALRIVENRSGMKILLYP